MLSGLRAKCDSLHLPEANLASTHCNLESTYLSASNVLNAQSKSILHTVQVWLEKYEIPYIYYKLNNEGNVAI